MRPRKGTTCRQTELFENGFNFFMCTRAKDRSDIPICGSLRRRQLSLWLKRLNFVLAKVPAADYRILAATMSQAEIYVSTARKKAPDLTEKEPHFSPGSKSYRRRERPLL